MTERVPDALLTSELSTATTLARRLLDNSLDRISTSVAKLAERGNVDEASGQLPTVDKTDTEIEMDGSSVVEDSAVMVALRTSSVPGVELYELGELEIGAMDSCSELDCNPKEDSAAFVRMLDRQVFDTIAMGVALLGSELDVLVLPISGLELKAICEEIVKTDSPVPVMDVLFEDVPDARLVGATMDRTDALGDVVETTAGAPPSKAFLTARVTVGLTVGVADVGVG
jgi:hypothetical protein